MRNVCATNSEYTAAHFLIDRVSRKYLELEQQFPAFVYVVQAGTDGPVKIGSANKPSARLKELQTSNWQKLYLRAVVPCGPCVRIEKIAHALACRHNLRGEWFDLHPLRAVEFVLSALVLDGHEPQPLEALIASLRVCPYQGLKDSHVEPYDSARRVELRRKLGID